MNEEVREYCRLTLLEQVDKLKKRLQSYSSHYYSILAIERGLEKGDDFVYRKINEQNHQISLQMLRDCQAALERLEKGEFGFCVQCGNQIPEDRLIAYPMAKRCVWCQKKAAGFKINKIR